MKILIVTDAWHPQVNGVVTTLSNVTKELIKAGHQVDIVEPSLFKSIPLVGYSEIKIAIETNQLKKYILNEKIGKSSPTSFLHLLIISK